MITNFVTITSGHFSMDIIQEIALDFLIAFELSLVDWGILLPIIMDFIYYSFYLSCYPF